MKNRTAAWTAVLAWAALSGPADAQQASTGPLTWEDCVSIALQKNPDLAASFNALEAGKANYRGSFNGLMPQLTLSNSYSDGSGSGGGSRWQAQAAASVSLFNAGRIAAVKSASASVSQSEASLRQTSASLRASLRQTFAQLLFAEKNVEVSRAIFDMRDRDSQMVTLRYDSGRESKGNMMRAKAQVLQARADLDQALRGMRSAQTALNRQLGLDDFTVVAATGTLEAGTPPELPADLGPLLAGRPDVALQAAAIKSAEAGVSQAKNSLWPSLSANYSRSRTGESEFPSSRTSWSAGGALSYPLFSGGPTAAYYAVSSARRNREKAEQDFRSVRNQAVTDLQSSWTSFAGAVDQVKVQAALLEAARQRNDEADVRYASGLLTFDSWEIIASDRISSERQAVSAQLNAVNAEASWQKSLGKPLGEYEGNP